MKVLLILALVAIVGSLFLSRNKNPSLFDAASLLGVGEISPVVLSTNGAFSIIQLIKKFNPRPHSFNAVSSKIESFLIKEGQKNSRSLGIDILFKKYTVEKNISLLY